MPTKSVEAFPSAGRSCEGRPTVAARAVEEGQPGGYFPLGTQERFQFDKEVSSAAAARRLKERDLNARSECPFRPFTAQWERQSFAAKSVPVASVGRRSYLSAEEEQQQHGETSSCAATNAASQHHDVSQQSKSSVFQRLSSGGKRSAAEERQRALLVELEAKRALEAPFRPVVNKRRPMSADPATSRQRNRPGDADAAHLVSDYPEEDLLLDSTRVEERLLAFGDASQRKKEDLRRERLLNESVSLTFHPLTTRVADRLVTQALPVRLANYVERQRTRSLERVDAAALGPMDSDVSFHPATNAVSAAIVRQQRADESDGGRRHGSVFERQYDEAHERRRRAEQRRIELEMEEAALVSSPLIDEASAAIVREQAQRPFWSRQAEWEERRKEKTAAMAKEADASERPRTALRVSAESQERAVQVLLDRHDISSRVRDELGERLFRDSCTFRPTLSAASRDIAASKGICRTNVVDRLMRDAHQKGLRLQKLAEAARRAEDEKVAADQRRIKIPRESPPPAAGGSARRAHSAHGLGRNVRALSANQSFQLFIDKQQRSEARRQQRTDTERQAVEETELIQCTFHPRTHSTPPPDVLYGDRTRAIPGLSRFLETRSLAERKKSDESARKEQLASGRCCRGAELAHPLSHPLRGAAPTATVPERLVVADASSAADGGTRPVVRRQASASSSSFLAASVNELNAVGHSQRPLRPTAGAVEGGGARPPSPGPPVARSNHKQPQPHGQLATASLRPRDPLLTSSARRNSSTPKPSSNQLIDAIRRYVKLDMSRQQNRHVL